MSRGNQSFTCVARCPSFFFLFVSLGRRWSVYYWWEDLSSAVSLLHLWKPHLLLLSLAWFPPFPPPLWSHLHLCKGLVALFPISSLTNIKRLHYLILRIYILENLGLPLFLQDKFLFLAKSKLDYPTLEFDHLTDYSWIEGLHTYYQICTSNSNLFIPIKGLSGLGNLDWSIQQRTRKR